jgi:hypothetical protein
MLNGDASKARRASLLRVAESRLTRVSIAGVAAREEARLAADGNAGRGQSLRRDSGAHAACGAVLQARRADIRIAGGG